MVWYSQTDPRWAKLLLGHNTESSFNLANFGCLVTAWSNLMLATTGNSNLTPAEVNEWLLDHDGFVEDTGIFIWSEALKMGGVVGKGTMADIAAVNQFLEADPNFAILEVKVLLRNGKFRQHFVLAPSVDRIVDSEDGQLKRMSTYLFVNAHLYTAIKLPVAVTTPPALPTSGNLNAVVQVKVPYLNARSGPHLSSPVVAHFVAGTAHTSGWELGDNVTVAGRTDNVWLKSDAGHWFAQAGTNANFGHTPAKLTAAQALNLSASTAYGSVERLKRVIFNRSHKKK